MNELFKYVLGVAAKSNVEKRKVGCIIVDSSGTIVAEGFNTETCPSAPFDTCVHAEAAACEDLIATAIEFSVGSLKAYVTHPPCPNCAKLLLDHGITDVEVIEEFKKFDGDKVRFDLVPPQVELALAEVFTYGARKHGENNWRLCKEPHRFEAALMRHWNNYRHGNMIDKDSGYHELAMIMSNVAMLFELHRQNDENTRQTDAHSIQNK